VVFSGNTTTNYLLTAKTQRSQRRWFFALAVRGRQSKGLRLFEAKAFSRSVPEAERLSFLWPPLTAGEKSTSTLCGLGDFAVNTVLSSRIEGLSVLATTGRMTGVSREDHCFTA
jgi:hypothetical protein